MPSLSSPRFFNAKIERLCSLSLVFLALVFLIAFGMVGLFRGGHMGFDFVVFREAGVQFLQGANPWLASIDTGAPFSYPPHILSFVAFYGALPFALGLAIHTIVILFSIGSVGYLANQWFLHIKDVRQMYLAQGIGLAFIVGSPFVAHSVYEGQWSLPAVAMVFWSWHFLNKKRWLLAGLFLGVATIKPQVSLLYIFWLLLSLQLRVLLVGGALAALMLLPSFAHFGIVETFSGWFASIEYYATQWANIPGSPHVVGMEGVFVALGITGLGWCFKVLSLLCLVLLYIYRQAFSQFLTLQLFFVIALTFIYGHDTDYVILSALWSYAVVLAFRQHSYVAVTIVGVLLFMMFFPQRFIRAFDIPLLFHTRTVVLVVICWYVWRWENNGEQEPNK